MMSLNSINNALVMNSWRLEVRYVDMKKTIEMTWCLIFVNFIQLEWILGLWKANDMY